MMLDCPKREKLNAMRLQDEKSDEDIARLNPLQMLAAIHVEVAEVAKMS